MRKEEIDILLKRFYSAESSAEEERLLADFFNATDIPEEYLAEKTLFNFYKDNLNIPEPSAGMDDKIIASLQTADRTAVRTLIYRVSGIAAGIMILVGSWVYFTRTSQEDTFDDPELAYVETMKILFDVSSRLNEGLATLEPVSGMNITEAEGFRVLARSKETLRENLDNLDRLDRIITGVNNMKENQ